MTHVGQAAGVHGTHQAKREGGVSEYKLGVPPLSHQAPVRHTSWTTTPPSA